MENEKFELPEAFVLRMRSQLGAEADAFFDSYRSPRAYGLRRNTQKLDREHFQQLMPWNLTQVPWAPEGYYYEPEDRPGRHVYHEMGLYYIQEPSAMSVAAIADPQPGEVILDLCAAPGGKSTQLAGRMNGEGLLVCNEIVPNRARILSQNIERMGIRHAVVLNHSPQELAKRFPLFFDRIIVDAPCSGEGMFHKEEAALQEWSPENVQHCAERQREILSCAVSMLRPGGVLVYSTCTFAPQEDEEMIAWLLETEQELSISPIDTQALGISDADISGCARIYPHRQRGEGHFIAKLVKQGHPMPRPDAFSQQTKRQTKKERPTDLWAGFDDFRKQSLSCELIGKRCQFGEQLYLVPPRMPDLTGLKVLRPGLHVGTNKKNRFEPAHALALALRAEEVRQVCETDEPEQFLRGMTLSCDGNLRGWVLVTYQGLPLGWGKANGGVVKNHYPKGLRINW